MCCGSPSGTILSLIQTRPDLQHETPWHYFEAEQAYDVLHQGADFNLVNNFIKSMPQRPHAVINLELPPLPPARGERGGRSSKARRYAPDSEPLSGLSVEQKYARLRLLGSSTLPNRRCFNLAAI